VRVGVKKVPPQGGGTYYSLSKALEDYFFFLAAFFLAAFFLGAAFFATFFLATFLAAFFLGAAFLAAFFFVAIVLNLMVGKMG